MSGGGSDECDRRVYHIIGRRNAGGQSAFGVRGVCNNNYDDYQLMFRFSS